MDRKITKEVCVGSLRLGGGNPILIQSMTNTDTVNFDATYAQIKALADGGCDIVRLTVPSLEAVETVKKLKASDLLVPLVADIHFDYKIALACAEAGIDKIRINPGNIGSDERVREVVAACKERSIPIRIGVNGGSLEKSILEKYGAPTPEALVESALYHVGLLEKFGFEDIVVSVKGSNVETMIEANRLLSEKIPYPLHLGVTEAGGARSGLVKSAVGIGTLLAEGIGDTVRVSLTDDPLLEVGSAKEILNALGLCREKQMDIVSCPTCGRTKISLIPLLKEFEERVDKEGLRSVPIRVALMGCAVNGPGEAREADIGIAGGVGEALLFSKGKILGKVAEDTILDTLIAEIRKWESARK